jgi:hypothetical protein
MPRHKPHDGEECRGCKDVMCLIVFGDEYNTEYPYEESDDGEHGPLRVLCDIPLILVGDGERRHDKHTHRDEVPGLE